MTYCRPMGGQEGISSPSCVPKQVWKLLARRLLEKRGRCAAERKFRLKSLTIGEHALTNVSDFTEDVPIYCEVTMLYLLLTVIGFILKPISLLRLIRCTRGRVVKASRSGRDLLRSSPKAQVRILPSAMFF